MARDNTLRELPVHAVPGTGVPPEGLRIDGLVACPLELTVDDLASLAQQSATGAFTCLEGWTVSEVRWQGVPLAGVLQRALPAPQARWVEASAGAFSVSLPIELARCSLLALRLDDDPLLIAHGGPVRLVVPGGECYTSVKWLDRLELREFPGPNTGHAIALDRLPKHSTES